MNKKVKHNTKALCLAATYSTLIMTQAYAGDIEHTLANEYDSVIYQSPLKELMRITGKGRVGINQAAPSAQLDIKWDDNVYPNHYNVKFTNQIDETIFGFSTNERNTKLDIYGQNPKLNLIGDDVSYYPGINFYGKGIPYGRFTAYHTTMIYSFDKHWFEGRTNGDHFMKVTSAGLAVGVGRWSRTTSKLQVVGLKEYQDNNDAKNRGRLTEGAFYRTGDLLKVVHD